MKIFVLTLGCPKNVVDSERLMTGMFNSKIQFVDHAEQADVVIINTCAFILPAREEAIEAILEAVELKKQTKIERIYVTGCLPQRYIDELQKEIPEVDGFFVEQDFTEIANRLAIEFNFSADRIASRRIFQTPGHYAYLKIAEGCDNRCHYCTIPIIKGNYQSRPIGDVIDEAKLLADSGARELIIVAQDSTYYGWDRSDKNSLSQLIEKLAAIPNIAWIRLLYAHPAHVNDQLIQLYQDEEKLCRYIDLPIQHISDRILKSMGRKTTSAAIKRIVDKFRTKVPEIAIRTTLMVGYPGEQDEDFTLLREFVMTARLERLGVFKYYAEEGTRSYKLPDHVDEQVKDERLEEIMELQSEIALEKNQELIGKTLPVIIDERDEDSSGFIGRTQWDSPSIDNIVHVAGKVKPGGIYPVTIDNVAEYEIWGDVK
ncbi:MAG TPA: 30S ribosomal protein S12 methylthiotransferase RimO [bacterium]